MRINLSELFTCEGKKKVYTLEFTLPSVTFSGETYRILKAEPFELEITGLGGRKFSMAGRLPLTLEAPCARCLEPVSFECELDFDREFLVGRTEEEQEESMDEENYLDGYNLDVDQLVCNELLVSLPMRILCSEDCKGICNRCGTNLNLRTCTCDTRELDPRMSVIQEIFNQFKEV